jgi:tRNA(fMet)-specific endonuclease VapC
VAQAKNVEHSVTIYLLLRHHLETFRSIQVLDFDDKAAIHFTQFQAIKELRRVNAADKKIAAIALANDATLITRNLRDFVNVPGLRVEDWSRSE